MEAPDRSQRASGPALAGLLALSVVVLIGARVLVDGTPQGSPGAGPPSASPTSTPSVIPAVTEPQVAVSRRMTAGLRFVDVTERTGLGGRDPRTPPGRQAMDAGAGVADLDDDGDLDVLLTRAGSASGIYANEDGHFEDVTRRSGIDELARSTVPVFGDVDGDRDLDVFIGGPGASFGRLLVNDGSGRFVDRSEARGVVGLPDRRAEQRRVRGADFGDVDLDGDLDLLVTDWNSSAVTAAAVAGAGPEGFETQCEYGTFMRRQYERGILPPSGDTRLFLNDGDGGFTDGTRKWGLAGLGATLALTPQFHDLDGDGWLDLVVAGDICTSRMFRNDRGRRFVDHTPATGTGTAENGMGSLVHDLDGDGRPDWMVTSIGYPTEDASCPRVSLFAGCSGNRVFLNRDRMRFRESTDALGLRNSWWGWGVAAADLANDGRVQVAVTNGIHPSGSGGGDDQESVYYSAFDDDPTQLWVRRGSGEFVDVAEQVGLVHRGVGFALVPFDYDRDGRVDLLITHAAAPPVLYRNVTTPRRHWLTLRLDDPSTPGNAQGLGARVEVTAATGRTSTQWMHTSGSYESQRPAEVHIGLGDDARPVRVRVWWPGTTRPQVVRIDRVDRVVTVTRAR